MDKEKGKQVRPFSKESPEPEFVRMEPNYHLEQEYLPHSKKTPSSKGMSAALKGKLRKMEKAGHQFSRAKNGKIKVPEGAEKYLTDDEIKQTVQMIEKEVKRQAPSRVPGPEMG